MSINRDLLPRSGTNTQVKTDFKWRAILYSYSAYFGIMLLGGLLGIHTTVYGAALFLTLLYGRYGFYLFRTRLDLLSYSIFLCLIIPLIPLVSFDWKTLQSTSQELIKYQALHLLILLGAALPLTPLSRAPQKRVLYLTIFTFLVCGCLWQFLKEGGSGRMQGFMPNPNGFALTSMMLLMLTDTRSRRLLYKNSSQLTAVIFLFLSRTSGALLGYLAGFLHRTLLSKRSNRLLNSVLLATSILLLSGLLAAIPRGLLKPVDATLDKISVAKEHFGGLLTGEKINYYQIIENKGQDVTSGLWRLSQWQKIIILFIESPVDKFLFGHGVGTTDILFNLKAHNDYLRLLFETGIIGLALNMMVWILIYRRMEPKYRWGAIMFAVFCFTENNYDHFPAMSLLAFFMLSGARAPKNLITFKQHHRMIP